MKRSWWAALALVAGIVLLEGCGGSSGPPFNPTPAIVNLFPSNITVGSDGFTLFVTGTGLISGSQGVTFAYWNGSPRSTTFNIVTNELQVSISAADVATPGTAQLTLWNPGPGGGASAASSFTIEPVQNGGPAISSVSPTSAKAGGPAFTLTVNGANFGVNYVIIWNGSLRTPTTISGNQASATITQNDIATVGSGSVTVSAPDLVDAAPSVAFPITGPDNPTPSTPSLSPSSVTASNLTDIEVTLGGSGFVPSSVAEWENTPLATAFISSSRLVVVVPAADIAAQGSAQITVTNPAPGGGTSSGATFTIKAP
ncbi:MAG: hypothetical protein ABSE45_03890 [Candidatus Acidiferrales bacterium]